MDHSSPPRLLERMRVKHYHLRTGQPYLDWIKRFIQFHRKRHPHEVAAY